MKKKQLKKKLREDAGVLSSRLDTAINGSTSVEWVVESLADEIDEFLSERNKD